VLRADYLHNFGTHFIIGRTIGTVNNPVVGGPDRVVQPRIECQNKIRRAAAQSGKALLPPLSVPQLIYAIEGIQLR
jgi:hypothetical protein